LVPENIFFFLGIDGNALNDAKVFAGVDLQQEHVLAVEEGDIVHLLLWVMVHCLEDLEV